MIRPRHKAALAGLLAGMVGSCASASPKLPAALAASRGSATNRAASDATPGLVPRTAPDVPAAPEGPLAQSLATYLRLLKPDPDPATLESFIASHPGWPNLALLRARLDAAIAADPDDGAVAAFCRSTMPEAADTLARCADATGDAAFARAAWRDGVDPAPASAAAFAARWGAAFSAEDDRRRFTTVLRRFPRDRPALADAASRTAPGERALADAEAALAGGAVADPIPLLAGVPAASRDDPTLVLEVARSLRLAGDLDAALAFWRERGFRVEAASAGPEAPASVAAFAPERDRLARDLLDAGRNEDAFAIADDQVATAPTARADALFLAGWIALRRLDRPSVAAQRFAALESLSPSLITRARGAYWLARAEIAAGDREAALRAAETAAGFPTTFYGQRALALLPPGSPGLAPRLLVATLPAASPETGLAFADGEMPRAAVLLVAWGEAPRARAFLLQADADATDSAHHALAARLAIGLGLPDVAVAIARRQGHDGVAMPALGWPRPVAPPQAAGVPAPLVLGVIRQESGFDPDARSPAGALGLMQLLPATGIEQGLAAGELVTPHALVADPALNMRLGTRFLARLLAREQGSVPAAVAAYNAGPHRVASWPPPPAGPLDDDATIDWIEGIPVAETRNYVERVLENEAVYAASAGAGAPAAESRAIGPAAGPG